MDSQNFHFGRATKTNAQVLARAFFASIAAHAMILGVLWQIAATQPMMTSMLRIELAPRAAPTRPASIAAQMPQAPAEPKKERAPHVISARSDRPANASTTISARTPPSFAPDQRAPDASDAAPASTQGIAEAATSSPAELAIDLRVLDWLARHREYPLAARRARIEGVVRLHVTLMPDGRLVDAKVERSSGHPLLDQAALDLMMRASPLPAEFASGRTGQIELQLPIVYRMRASST